MAIACQNNGGVLCKLTRWNGAVQDMCLPAVVRCNSHQECDHWEDEADCCKLSIQKMVGDGVGGGAWDDVDWWNDTSVSKPGPEVIKPFSCST